MDVALEQFVKQLTDSGVIAPSKLESFVPPKAQPKDAQELARQLVQGKQLTKFQAQEIYQGRSKSLILGNYTILDKIGAGGMGQVFKAEHRRMHRVVAIKVLPQSVTKDAAAVARFQREVEAAAKLEHPNIVTAHDADEAGGVHFLVMQCVEGNDLSALVKKNGPFPFAKAVNYILQAARGLEFAHGEGVVHRDIKPANLLLDKKGTVKILDMGLARINTCDDAATQAELTGTGAVLGTVDYIAPEQALNAKQASYQADIYSLGCTLYCLIVGKAVYEGDTIMEKLLAHREAPIPSLGTDVPEELQVVFQKMVAKRVDDRYQTMHEVVAGLEKCQIAIGASDSIAPTISLPSAGDHPALLTGPGGRSVKNRLNRGTLIALAASAMGLAILTAVVFKLHTKDGTLVVTVNQTDAVVQVLNEEGKVEINDRAGKDPLTISVDPGKHRLKVEKAGFQLFAQDFAIESGGSASIQATLQPVAAKITNVTDLAFQQWMKYVAAMPAEQQVEAVSKKLIELNTGFDGKVTGADGTGTPKIVSGVVTELGFVSDSVTDISPVRALPGLNGLNCCGSSWQRISNLTDLSPLNGMALTKLDCGATQVSDLSPLKEMHLTELNGAFTKISDLSPLRGLPLTKLDLRVSHVRDLSPLKGMALKWLECWSTSVADLSPLKGMPLAYLGCGSTQVFDLSPLEGMPLAELHFNRTHVSDISALKGMPLEEVQCDGTPVSDLSALQGMSLTTITFTPRNINQGLDVIRQMRSLKAVGIEWDQESPPAEFWTKYDAGEFGKPDRFEAGTSR